MNERIRELAVKAKFMAEETINKQISKNAELDAFAEKFAELIVGECCFVGEQYADGLFDSKHYAFVNKKVKEHFGVEEK